MPGQSSLRFGPSQSTPLAKTPLKERNARPIFSYLDTLYVVRRVLLSIVEALREEAV
jgi:hypothetical protein